MNQVEALRVRQGPRRCAFCHDDLPTEERVACADCLAAHHQACWQETGCCASCQSVELLSRSGEPVVVLDDPIEPTELLSELFERSGYESLVGAPAGVTVYQRSRKTLLNIAGETFSDTWVIIDSDVDLDALCQQAIDFVAERSFQHFWHYLTRDAWVNFVLLGKDPVGGPEPARRRHFITPTTYTVSRYSRSTKKLDIQTTWTGSIKAKPVLIALRYALETGALPKDGALLSEDLGAKSTTQPGRRFFVIFFAIFSVLLAIALLVAMLAR